MIKSGALILYSFLLLGSQASAADWNFAVGGTYISGLNDVADILEGNLESRGFTVDTLVIPIGLSFQGYTEWDSGLAAGFSLGPAIAAYGDIEFFDLPVGVDARYFLGTGDKTRTYIRAGIRYHIAGGDDIKSSDVGALGGIGVEFREKGKSGWAIEIAYDASEIEMINLRSNTGRESVKPAAVMLSAFAVF